MNDRAQVEAVLNGSIMLGIGNFDSAVDEDEREQLCTRLLFRSAVGIGCSKHRRLPKSCETPWAKAALSTCLAASANCAKAALRSRRQSLNACFRIAPSASKVFPEGTSIVTFPRFVNTALRS
jgi:hypothetical protein